jgi:hypothetical protein
MEGEESRASDEQHDALTHAWMAFGVSRKASGGGAGTIKITIFASLCYTNTSSISLVHPTPV